MVSVSQSRRLGLSRRYGVGALVGGGHFSEHGCSFRNRLLRVQRAFSLSDPQRLIWVGRARSRLFPSCLDQPDYSGVVPTPTCAAAVTLLLDRISRTSGQLLSGLLLHRDLSLAQISIGPDVAAPCVTLLIPPNCPLTVRRQLSESPTLSNRATLSPTSSSSSVKSVSSGRVIQSACSLQQDHPSSADRKRGALRILASRCSPRGNRCRRSPVTR